MWQGTDVSQPTASKDLDPANCHESNLVRPPHPSGLRRPEPVDTQAVPMK